MDERNHGDVQPRPLVSVITPTHNRPAKLRRAIGSVLTQTYAPVEHVVVGDGPQPLEVKRLIEECPQVRYFELGRNWHEHVGNIDWGATPRMVGTYLARGKYLAFLDDDNAYIPQHIEKLVDLLVASGANFAWSKLAKYRHLGGPAECEIGDGVPRLCGIDTNQIIAQAELMQVANWRTAGYEADWDLVERWLAHGASHVFLNETTVHYEIQR